MTAPSAGAAEPLVTIILAVSNGWDETFRLLLALVGSTGDIPVETVVVDDGTTDETALALPRLPGLRVHRNERPLGLAVARRQGAAMARGRWIAVLPSRAAPGSGWLDRLLAGADAAAAPDLADPLPDGGLLVAAGPLRAPTGRGTAIAGPPPRFTVMVPSYNQAHYLPATLGSLRSQTLPDWEAVVVDDGSTDGTPQVLAAQAADDPRIRVFRKPNGGVATALNEALRRARGEWICWLSSDDLFEPDALAAFSRGMAEHPGCRFFHADFSYLVEETGQKAATVDDRHVPQRAFQVIRLLQDNCINGISVCVHRSVFDEVGAFDPRLRYGQDVDMWLRASARFPYVRLRHHVCITRVHREMGTAGFPQAGPYDVARACLEFLNTHAYPRLFPTLDLQCQDDAARAIEATLRVVVALDAHMYRGVGHVTALLDRLQEWFAGPCPPPLRPQIAAAVAPLADRLRAQGLPTRLATALDRLRTPTPAPFEYRPADPLALMRSRLLALEAVGDPEAPPLRRYLSMVDAAATVR